MIVCSHSGVVSNLSIWGICWLKFALANECRCEYLSLHDPAMDRCWKLGHLGKTYSFFGGNISAETTTWCNMLKSISPNRPQFVQFCLVFVILYMVVGSRVLLSGRMWWSWCSPLAMARQFADPATWDGMWGDRGKRPLGWWFGMALLGFVFQQKKNRDHLWIFRRWASNSGVGAAYSSHTKAKAVSTFGNRILTRAKWVWRIPMFVYFGLKFHDMLIPFTPMHLWILEESMS